MTPLALLAAAAASDYQCTLEGPVPGTLGRAIVTEARDSAGDTYGAVEVLNREVMPRLGNSSFAMFMGSTSIFNVAQLPVNVSDACPNRSGEVNIYQYDINAVNFATAIRAGRVTLQYSTSALMGSAPMGNFWRGMMIAINTLGGTYWAIAAPLNTAGDNVTPGFEAAAEYALDYDYIAGATADLWVAEIGGGYVGSKGFYVTGISREVGAFARAVTSDNLDRIPQIVAGVARRELIPDSLSSVYGRRVETGPKDQQGASLFDRDALETAHVDQEAIAGILDVKGAMAIRPDVDLHGLQLRLHKRIDPDDLEDDAVTPEQVTGFWLGEITAQPQPDYDLEKARLVQAGFRWSTIDEGMLVSLEAALNSDDVLAAFPYARNSVFLRLQIVPAYGEVPGK